MQEHFSCLESYGLLAYQSRAFIRHQLVSGYDYYFCLNPRSAAAQTSEAKPEPTDHEAVSPSSMPQRDKLQTTRHDLNIDSLPDATTAAGAGTGRSSVPRDALGAATEPTAGTASGTDQKPLYRGATSFGSISIHPLARQPWVLPALGTGFQMLNPPSHYPREWKGRQRRIWQALRVQDG